MQGDYLQAQQAAEYALLAMAVRAVLARGIADEPAVVSLALDAELSPTGGCTVILEYRDRAGMALGGVEL